MATYGERIMTTRANKEKKSGEEGLKDLDKQTVNEQGTATTLRMAAQSDNIQDACKVTDVVDERSTGQNTRRESVLYGKELTVEVEVDGTANVSMMDLLKEVKKECGIVMGCRVRGDRIFELTMKDESAKAKLMDGLRVKNAAVHAKDIINNEMVVSFINLPVYIEDLKILSKLEDNVGPCRRLNGGCGRALILPTGPDI